MQTAHHIQHITHITEHISICKITSTTAPWSSTTLYVIDLRSFVIRFDFESYIRFEIRFVVMVQFEIFESSALSIVIRKETIRGG